MDEQNKFWEEEKRRGERVKQKENIPRKFEPKTPVKVLQRGKQSRTAIPSQAPTRPRDVRYTQGQYYSWSNGYVEPEYRGGCKTGYSYGTGYGYGSRNWGQGNGYGKKYGVGNKRGQGRACKPSGTQSHTYYKTHGTRGAGKYTPSRGIGGSQEGNDGNGGNKGNGDKKRYRSTKYDFEDMDEEESDTEDSFELEITPQQLSQVTPGEGILMLTLSKKKPLKITTGAPSREPDPSQTTVKTVYDPKEEKRDQPVKGTTNIAKSGLEQPKGGETPPMGGREPPHKGENERPDRPPGGRGDPNDGNSNGNWSSHRNGNGNGRLHRNGGPNGNGGPNRGGDWDGNGEPPRRGEEPPRRNGESGGGGAGSDPSDDDGGGNRSSSSSSNTTPPRRRRHRPRFVCVIQGPPGPPGQVGQPGQTGRDGRDGQAPQLTRALEEALRAQRGNFDITSLENSFDHFGRTMTEVLNAQQRVNRNLEEQFRRANETVENQTEAMQDMAQVNYQMKFDHMFAMEQTQIHMMIGYIKLSHYVK